MFNVSELSSTEKYDLINDLKEINKNPTKNLLEKDDVLALIGLEVYDLGTTPPRKRGAINHITQYREGDQWVLHLENGHSNYFDYLRLYPEYGLVGDYPCSSWVVPLDIEEYEVCRPCINSCKIKDLESCPFKEVKEKDD